MLLDVMKFHKILLRFIKYLKILSSTGKDGKILLNFAKLPAKISLNMF